MQITFRLTEKDHRAFLLHFWDNSPTLRRSRTRQTILMWILCLAIVVVESFRHGFSVGLAVVAAALFVFIGIVYIPLMRRFGRWLYIRRCIRVMADSRRPAEDEVCSFELAEVGLLLRSETANVQLKWKDIDHVAVTTSHVFVYFAASRAIPISRLGVLEGDLDAFTAELKAGTARAEQEPAL